MFLFILLKHYMQSLGWLQSKVVQRGYTGTSCLYSAKREFSTWKSSNVYDKQLAVFLVETAVKLTATSHKK